MKPRTAHTTKVGRRRFLASAAASAGVLGLARGRGAGLPETPAADQGSSNYFAIRMVDEKTGRGVPLVELKTTNSILYYTDSNGFVAFDEPGLMDREVWFSIQSPGYEFPENTFGERGKALKPTRGGSAVLKIRRFNLAERLYRVTGEGIYRDSVLIGAPVPIKHPVLDAQVMGQDTVMATPYRDKIYWFFGDTAKSSFPLGNFGTSGATSEWPGKGGLDPAVGVDLNYFADASGFSKPMIPASAVPGPGPKWTDAVMVVDDGHGSERLVAHYVRVKNLGEIYERGLVIFDDKTESFDRLVRFDLDAPLNPAGRPFLVSVNGERYYYFASPYPAPLVRVKADLKHITDPSSYEGFTCLAADARHDPSAPKLDRAADGRLIYGWKSGTPPLSYKQQDELITAGKMEPEEKGLVRLEDMNTGDKIEHTTGSVYWNDYRRRWIMIAMGNLDEVWYAEADTPLGPWVYTTKVAIHGHYTFYWPGQSPFFDQEGGRMIYFMGTYTNTFSGNPCQTPRYDYNQLMYRLRLDDPELFLPVPIYQVKSAEGKSHYLTREGVEARNAWDQIEGIPFFALPPGRARDGLLPIFSSMDGSLRSGRAQAAIAASKIQPLFYALPAGPLTPAELMTGTWQCEAKGHDGSKFTFVANFELKGTKVIASAAHGGLAITGGTFKDGLLRIDVKRGEHTYLLSGALKKDMLTGEYRETSGAESGTWEGRRTDFIGRQDRSPAVIQLYEYRQGERGARFYSTNPNLEEPGTTRAARPICRVWRNPLPLLILDRSAQRIPIQRAASTF